MRIRLGLWLLIGLGAGILGLLPWLVHGAVLPLQNLWLGSQGRVIALLPFSQYAVTTIAGLLIEGAAAAGLVALLVRGARSGGERALLVVGVVLVQAVAIVQTAAAVSGGLASSAESRLYLAALVAGAVLSLLIGVSVALLVSSPAPAAVVVGAGLAAPLLAGWLGGFVFDPFAVTYDVPAAVGLLRWVPPIVVGLATARSRLRTPAQVVAALFAVVALWLGFALTAAISNAAGARVYARMPAEMVRFGLDVLRSALAAVDQWLPSVVVAVVVAAVGVVALRLRARRSDASRGA